MIHQLVAENYPKTVALPDGTPLLLRALEPTDRQALWDFFRRIPDQDRLFLKHDVSQRTTIDSWCDSIDYNKTLPMLATKEGEVIGDATLHQDQSGWLSHVGMVRVVVAPDYRGKGVGWLLFEQLIEIATLSNLDCLEAEFLEEQERAIASFEKLG